MGEAGHILCEARPPSTLSNDRKDVSRLQLERLKFKASGWVIARVCPLAHDGIIFFPEQARTLKNAVEVIQGSQAYRGLYGEAEGAAG